MTRVLVVGGGTVGLSAADFGTIERTAIPETPDLSPATRAGGCAQDRIDRILVEEARKRGATIRFGTRLERLEQDRDKVTATLDTGTVTADYAIAADGAGSGVRRGL